MWCIFVLRLVLSMIGASLSEPHTSVTAFAEVVCIYVCMYVCMSACLWPYTVNFK